VSLVIAAVVVDLAIVGTYFHLPPEAAAPLRLSFPVQIKNWLLWTALAPAIAALARAMMVQRWSWVRRASSAVALGITLAFAHVAMEILSVRAHGSATGHAADAMGFFSYHLWHGLLTFAVLFTVAVLIESERASREREIRETQLHEQVSRTQLQMLRMQLQPHFLFNTLNSISALVEDDARAGQRMIGQLSEFLRLTLAETGHADVPLRTELAMVRTYVELEQTRFADRLSVSFEIHPEANDALVPNLILQPLVENAIRHGIQPSLTGGTVTVRAARDGTWLVLDVLDDGVGLPNGIPDLGRSGIGLANTRARLEQRYGGRHEFTIERRTTRGTHVRVRVPWQMAAGMARTPMPAVAS
jgi:signal transduction histidine kinase